MTRAACFCSTYRETVPFTAPVCSAGPLHTHHGPPEKLFDAVADKQTLVDRQHVQSNLTFALEAGQAAPEQEQKSPSLNSASRQCKAAAD
jgi:hypothetical protein